MAKRIAEVFTAGCPVCAEALRLVRQLACSQCEVRVYDLSDEASGQEHRGLAEKYGIGRLPAVVVDGTPVGCCRDLGPVTRDALVEAGIGRE